MIPYALTEFHDPEPDEELADAAYDARREQEAAGERRDFSDEEWEAISGYDSGDGALARPRAPVDAGDGERHRAAEGKSQRMLW